MKPCLFSCFSFSENYLTVKGTALILARSECGGRSVLGSSGGKSNSHCWRDSSVQVVVVATFRRYSASSPAHDLCLTTNRHNHSGKSSFNLLSVFLQFVFALIIILCSLRFAGSKTGMWNTHTKPLFSRGHNKRLPGHRRSCHTGLVSLTNSKLMMTSLWWRGIEYSCFLSGFDLENDKATIGLVLPVWSDTLIRFDGDGLVQCYNSGFSLLYKLLKAGTDIIL